MIGVFSGGDKEQFGILPGKYGMNSMLPLATLKLCTTPPGEMETHELEIFIGKIWTEEVTMRQLLTGLFIQNLDQISKLANMNTILFATDIWHVEVVVWYEIRQASTTPPNDSNVCAKNESKLRVWHWYDQETLQRYRGLELQQKVCCTERLGCSSCTQKRKTEVSSGLWERRPLKWWENRC